MKFLSFPAIHRICKRAQVYFSARLWSQKETPQQLKIQKDGDPSDLIRKAAAMLDVDMLFFKQSGRIPQSVTANRDLLVYFLWKTGILTNTKIGELFGVRYASISHIVISVQSGLERNKGHREKFMKTYSLFTM